MAGAFSNAFSDAFDNGDDPQGTGGRGPVSPRRGFTHTRRRPYGMWRLLMGLLYGR
jgi:hypothetical protein